MATCRDQTQQGVAAMESGDWEEAEKHLEAAIKAVPDDPEARRHYAEVLWHQGDREQAIGQLEQVARPDCPDVSILVRLAEMRLAAGQTDAAAKDAERALDVDPRFPAAWAIRAKVMQGAGYLPQALADYQRALGYAPDDRDILFAIAELYRRLNEPQRALATLHSLADTFPRGEEPQEVLYLEGLAYAALGRDSDAVDSLSLAASRGQPRTAILYNLAEAELRAGRTQEAEFHARQALQLQPEHRPSVALLHRLDMARRPQPIRPG